MAGMAAVLVVARAADQVVGRHGGGLGERLIFAMV
jgi:hypothetical protein